MVNSTCLGVVVSGTAFSVLCFIGSRSFWLTFYRLWQILYFILVHNVTHLLLIPSIPVSILQRSEVILWKKWGQHFTYYEIYERVTWCEGRVWQDKFVLIFFIDNYTVYQAKYMITWCFGVMGCWVNDHGGHCASVKIYIF